MKDGEKPAPLIVDFARVGVRDSVRGPVTSLRVDSYHADTDEESARGKRETARDRILTAMQNAGSEGIDFDAGKRASTKTNATVSEAFSKMVADGEAETFTGPNGQKRWRYRPGGPQ